MPELAFPVIDTDKCSRVMRKVPSDGDNKNATYPHRREE